MKKIETGLRKYWYWNRNTLPDLMLKLEQWWNENPEMRWIELLCGQNKRFCVRLYEIDMIKKKVAESEAGTAEDAFRQALEQLQNKPK